MTKQQLNVRISTITRRQIDELVAATNATAGEIVMMAVDRMSREEAPMDGARYFKYMGPCTGTRGEYGVAVRGGHNTDDAPGHISVFDTDYGDSIWISIETGLSSGEWIEITPEEWANLS
jgi:hypothetical protein